MDSHSIVSVCLPSNPIMRTEAEFIEQAELARSSLQQFVAVKDFDNADDIKVKALNKLIKNTVSRFLFLKFSSFF
jgi:hypothetical protein